MLSLSRSFSASLVLSVSSLLLCSSVLSIVQMFVMHIFRSVRFPKNVEKELVRRQNEWVSARKAFMLTIVLATVLSSHSKIQCQHLCSVRLMLLMCTVVSFVCTRLRACIAREFTICIICCGENRHTFSVRPVDFNKLFSLAFKFIYASQCTEDVRIFRSHSTQLVYVCLWANAMRLICFYFWNWLIVRI